MTQDELIAIDEISRVLRDATRDYAGYRTIGEWANLAAKTIERLREKLKQATESQQRLTLDNACWQAENRKIGNELVAATKAKPPRPAAMLWTDGTVWHAYERYEDADRDRNQAAKEPPLMVVKEWTWHPKSS